MNTEDRQLLEKIALAIDDNRTMTNASIVALLAIVAEIPGAKSVDLNFVENNLRNEMRGATPSMWTGITNILNAFKHATK